MAGRTGQVRQQIREVSHMPPRRGTSNNRVRVDDEGRYWLLWTQPRGVYKAFGPGGCRGKTVERNFRYRVEVHPRVAREWAEWWGRPVPCVPEGVADRYRSSLERSRF